MANVPSKEHSNVIVVREHSEVGPFELTDRDHRMLETVVNQGNDGSRLQLRYTRDGRTCIKTTAHVGMVSLPDGPTLQIEPKAGIDNVLTLLRYAFGSDLSVLETQEELVGDGSFIETMAVVFLDEIDTVLTKGLEKSYVQTRGTERHLRGQLDTQRQLQRSLIAPTSFECRYEDLTYDTILNKIVLRATTLLRQFVADSTLAGELDDRVQRLGQRVSDEHVSWEDAEQLELNRLNEYYNTVLQIARYVLRYSFVSDLRRGDQISFSLLVNMNRVFERLVERATTDLADSRADWSVETQIKTDSLLQGRPRVPMYPDVAVRKRGQPLVVADAKWKTRRKNEDIYQVLAYMSAYDVPGMLLYPGQQGTLETTYTVKGGSKLALVELPTNAAMTAGEGFSDVMTGVLSEAIDELLS